MKLSVFVASLVSVTAVAVAFLWLTSRLPHPDEAKLAEWAQVGEVEAKNYRTIGYRAAERIAPFVAGGNYLRYAETVFHRPSDRLQLDGRNLPLIKYGESFEYNPVTISEFAIAEQGRSLSGGDTTAFVAASYKLMELQGTDGALRYNFSFDHYATDKPLAPGWVSGMAQGLALSAYGRAYRQTGDHRFIEAGEKALEFMQLPYPDGTWTKIVGISPETEGRGFYLEYPVLPHVYTLNGYMYALLGLYEWGELTDSDKARKLFDDGAETLTKILPFYDIGTISTYDLSYLVMADRKPYVSARYHAIHIAQLHALHSITGIETFAEFEGKWLSQVEP